MSVIMWIWRVAFIRARVPLAVLVTFLLTRLKPLSRSRSPADKDCPCIPRVGHPDPAGENKNEGICTGGASDRIGISYGRANNETTKRASKSI